MGKVARFDDLTGGSLARHLRVRRDAGKDAWGLVVELCCVDARL